MTPLVDSLKGVKAALTHDEDTQAIMFAGASFLGGGQFGGDFDTQADTLRRAMTKKGFPKSAADTLAIGPKFWQMYRRSEEHTSELQSLMRISYAVLCLKKKQTTT